MFQGRLLLSDIYLDMNKCPRAMAMTNRGRVGRVKNEEQWTRLELQIRKVHDTCGGSGTLEPAVPDNPTHQNTESR